MSNEISDGGATVPCISLFGLWLGLAAGNFVYQCFAGNSWATATERSFFQLAAFVALWLTQRITKPNSESEVSE